jgi:hypothetical protein
MTINETKQLGCQRRVHECIYRTEQSTNQITRDDFAAMAETWTQLAMAMATSASHLDRREQLGARRGEIFDGVRSY